MDFNINKKLNYTSINRNWQYRNLKSLLNYKDFFYSPTDTFLISNIIHRDYKSDNDKVIKLKNTDKFDIKRNNENTLNLPIYMPDLGSKFISEIENDALFYLGYDNGIDILNELNLVYDGNILTIKNYFDQLKESREQKLAKYKEKLFRKKELLKEQKDKIENDINIKNENIDELKGQLQEVNESIYNLKQEIQDLKSRLGNLDKDKEKQSLKEKISNKQKELKDKNKLKESLEKRIKKIKNKRIKLKSKLKTTLEKLENLNSDNSKIKKEINKLKQFLYNLDLFNNITLIPLLQKYDAY